jgi:hypothetical protein
MAGHEPTTAPEMACCGFGRVVRAADALYRLVAGCQGRRKGLRVRELVSRNACVSPTLASVCFCTPSGILQHLAGCGAGGRGPDAARQRDNPARHDGPAVAEVTACGRSRWSAESIRWSALTVSDGCPKLACWLDPSFAAVSGPRNEFVLTPAAVIDTHSAFLRFARASFPVAQSVSLLPLPAWRTTEGAGPGPARRRAAE